MKKNSKIAPSKTKAAATAEKGRKAALPVEVVGPEDAPQKPLAAAGATAGKTRPRAVAGPAAQTPAGRTGKSRKKEAPSALEPDDGSRSSGTVLDVDEPEHERDTDELDIDSPDSEDELLDDDLDEDDEPRLTSEDGQDRSVPAPSSSRVPAVGTRDSLHLYLREVSRFPMLKPEEEHELAVRVRDHNDADAAFRLVSSHLRLVVRIAMDFQRRWMQNVLDLVQEGNVGLMRAVNKFDPDKGIKFSYYASFWIKAYILKFIMDNWRMVKIGTTQVQRKLFYNLNRERQKLIMQGYDPDATMLSERLGVTEEQINEMDQRLASTDMSLNAQVGEDSGGATRMDFLPALGPGIEDSLASTEIAGIVRSKLKTIMPKLNEKEQYILHNRLLSDEPITLREIGERYNITRERVRQLEARLVEKIGQHMKNDIEDFSDHWIQS
ncbi:RNA polymerase factor sigma-32 [Desulfovibrio sp.]|uniref:sigma-70 family RNA polymerase sigma factor n=1 Tax=Desulfovibrio sp. TaxID=885 RepID=UPI0025BBA903|nr:RNA polymerase factor sigma-32 [Desulfovibrio sp.]